MLSSTPTTLKAPMTLWKKLALVAGLGLAVTGYRALSDFHDKHAFLINASESLPNWAFLVSLGKFPARGDFVVFDPGKDELTVKHFGQHPAPFAKIAYGIPGDAVTRVGNDVAVNGKVVVRIKPLTKQGEVLVPGPLGVVPHGCIFAGTPHKDGFDSRYKAIGFVCRDRLLGVGSSIL